MLKVPSGLRSHPSNTGATFWPRAYWTWARAALTERNRAQTAQTQRIHYSVFARVFFAFRASACCLNSSSER